MKRKYLILFLVAIIAIVSCGFKAKEEKDFIKWVDCNVTYELMRKAYELDVKYHDSDKVHFDFVKGLAYIATRNGNKFTQNDIRRLKELENALLEGKEIDDFYGENKYYKYYVESYTAIFSQFIGDYIDTSTNKTCYGLKNYHPIAANYWYTHGDDFGNSRSYGFKRRHLGHDMMGSTGTPIISIESGVVSDIGWNKYGGWRIGIRSVDNKRSYYYAHLRKGHPYAGNLKMGDNISAGQVIGYLGVTGYSTKENINMTCKPHLHIGMQLIFDDCQIQGPKEIWIDMYQITKFLSNNRAQVVKDGKEYSSINLKKSV